MPSPRFNALMRALAGSGGGLAPFAFQAETTALTAAFTTPPTARRKMAIDTAIKRLKDAGVWSKLAGLWVVGADQQSSLLNWVNPAQSAIVRGTPTFVANSHYVANATGDYIETGLIPSAFSPSTCGVFGYFVAGTDSGDYDIGCHDNAGVGMTLNIFNSFTSTMSSRCGSSTVAGTIATGVDWATAKARFHATNRVNASTFNAWRGPVKKASITNTAAASFGTGKLTLLGVSVNGNAPTATSKRGTRIGGFINGVLTDAQMATLANTCEHLSNQLLWGELDLQYASMTSSTITADLVVYGFTSQAIIAAYEAKRQGLSVAVVGGWRDSEANFGGMSANGLGSIDMDSLATSGGLPRWVLDSAQTILGKAPTSIKIPPQTFQQVFRGLCDPRITNGLDITFYPTGGIASATTSAARVTSITCVDGRTFAGTYFIDASYEGDLMVKAGISTRVGREDTSEFSESLAGFRGTSSRDKWINTSGTPVNIDPYITPGVPSSGLLPYLEGELPATSTGTGDSKVQAYNFRLILTTDKSFLVPFPSTPPAGYDPLWWEPMLRLLGAVPAYTTMASLFNRNQVGDTTIAGGGGYNSTYDFNNGPGISTDLVGQGHSSAFPTASYATRETAYQAHVTHILGLMYTLQYLADARVPAALRTDALTYGLDSRHHVLERPGDLQNFPCQLYVREANRMVNDFMMRQSDMQGTDGTTPRSIKTVSVASYAIDSHHVAAYANAATPRIMFEGEFFNSISGGTDKATPIPYEAITPRKAECENVAVVFGIAATHVAFGAIRMEFCSMQLAQSAAIAAKIAKTASNQALQDVDYPTLRTALLASNTLSGETAPVLPQVN